MLVFRGPAGDGARLAVAPYPFFQPQPFTILGWAVPDIRAAVAELRARGVEFRRFEGMSQDDLGVWTSPAGAKVAWFTDPDGNVLSLTEG